MINTTALLYALGTVLCWGVYSVMLHMGSVSMRPDGLLNGKPVPPDLLSLRMKAFLFVGIAYFVMAVIVPLFILKSRIPSDGGEAARLAGSSWTMPTKGWTWSLYAGFAGAIGAFFLLMALSAGKSAYESKNILPLLVPAIVFAGAPIVNVLVSTTKEGNWSYVNVKFILGIVLAAAGTAMVMKYKPAPPVPDAAPAPAAAPAAPAHASVAPGYRDVTRGSYHVS